MSRYSSKLSSLDQFFCGSGQEFDLVEHGPEALVLGVAFGKAVVDLLDDDRDPEHGEADVVVDVGDVAAGKLGVELGELFAG